MAVARASPTFIEFSNSHKYTHTLIFSVSTLHLFMHILLHFALKHSCSRWLIKVGDFKDVRRIDPVICATTHHMVSLYIELVYWDLTNNHCRLAKPLY